MSTADSLIDPAPAPPGDGATPPAPGPTPPAPGPSPAPGPAPGPAPAPAAGAGWLEGLADAGKAYIEAKGFKSPGDALAALKAYEPPETADKYEVTVPEGASVDEGFAKAMREAAHKAGLPAPMFKAMVEANNAYAQQQREAARVAEEAKATEAEALAKQQDADLRREWGDKYDGNAELAKRAVGAYVPGDPAGKRRALEALEDVV